MLGYRLLWLKYTYDKNEKYYDSLNTASISIKKKKKIQHQYSIHSYKYKRGILNLIDSF